MKEIRELAEMFIEYVDMGGLEGDEALMWPARWW